MDEFLLDEVDTIDLLHQSQAMQSLFFKKMKRRKPQPSKTYAQIYKRGEGRTDLDKCRSIFLFFFFFF